MKTWWIAALAAGLMVTMLPTDSEARRLGGGKSAGMQRSTPDKAVNNPQTPPAATPTTPAPAAAAAPTAGAAAAAAAPKRSWMGPIAGLAAGLGLAALLGHFGLGGEFANLLMMVLLGVAAFVVIRMLMKRFAGGAMRGMQPVPAGASAGVFGRSDEPRKLTQRASWTPGAGAAAAATGSAVVANAASADAAVAPASLLPEGFDAEAFERIAKTIFIRMQAANDSADLNDLRNFTTPELFATLRVDLHERGDTRQQTDVVTVQAQVLEFAQEPDRQIVSVRFQGLMREEADTAASPFDEVWHLVRQGDSPAWAIAGIQQTS